MRRARRILAISFAALALSQAGCLVLAAGAAGGGAVAWGVTRGTIHREFDAGVEATAAATQSALQDLNLPVERPYANPTYGEIDSTLPSGGPILLTLKSTSAGLTTAPTTRVEVHIKVFGDKEMSERILDQIGYRLKNPAPPPAPTSALPPQQDQTEEPPLAPKQ